MKKIFFVLLIMIFCISGCGSTKEQNPDSEVENKYDLEGKLKKAEEDSAVLENKLATDSSLKQMDMNQIANEIYVIWDELLNDMWEELKVTLDEKTKNDLLAEQRDWIADKEEQVKEAAAVFEGGSMAPFAGDRKAAELTKERVYELAGYFAE